MIFPSIDAVTITAKIAVLIHRGGHGTQINIRPRTSPQHVKALIHIFFIFLLSIFISLGKMPTGLCKTKNY